MNSFQQACPSCNSVLELPIEAAGKSAICPGCQTQFIAQVATDADVALADASPEKPTEASPSRFRTTPASYHPISIESILGDSRNLFADRRRPLLLPFLIPSVLVLVGLIVPLAYISDMAIISKTRALTWSAGLMPWFLVVITYTLWFATNLSIDVCDAGPESDDQDQKPSKLRSWFVPDLRVFLALLVTVTVFVLVAATLISVAVALINSGRNVRATEVKILMTLGATLGATVGTTLFATRFWPLIPMAMEGRFGVQALQDSLAITRINLLTSFLMVIALLFLVGVGFSLMGLGLPIAIPIASLTLLVGLRMIEGRSIPALERHTS